MIKKRKIITILLALLSMMGQEIFAQDILANFENGTAGKLKISTNYDSSLFSATPRVRTNPSKTGINTSNRCVTATNVANAGWWKNFLILDLKEPVTITDDNRILSLLAYRSSSPRICALASIHTRRAGSSFRANSRLMQNGNASASTCQSSWARR